MVHGSIYVVPPPPLMIHINTSSSCTLAALLPQLPAASLTSPSPPPRPLLVCLRGAEYVRRYASGAGGSCGSAGSSKASDNGSDDKMEEDQGEEGEDSEDGFLSSSEEEED